MRRVALLCWTVLALSACNAEPHVMLKGERFSVEVADERDEQALGLMFRREMPADHGMLFIFESETPRSFWMKNTFIHLDILYFDRDRRLVSLHENVPPCGQVKTDCPGYPSRFPARYVLELNAGTAERLDVQRGSELVISVPGED